MTKPKTLQQAMAHFADPDNCLKYFVSRRWPNGVECPTCGSRDVRFIPTRRLWECKTKHPKRQFSAKVGTIFEDSALPLDKWLIAMWMLTNCKNGVSSYEVGRSLGITQKSAWFMLQRLRLAMQNKSLLKLGGAGKEIEVDETFIGGAARFMHPSRRRRAITARGVKDKAAAFAILERDGEIRTFAVPNRKKHGLQGMIVEHVQPGTSLYSDALMSYMGLTEKGFEHKVIDHANRYVDGKVHTNGLENFWSLLKRGLKGTYVSVEPFHLFRYLDEQAFRYNNRATKENPLNDGDRFDMVLSRVMGKRLTFAEVTGKVGSSALN